MIDYQVHCVMIYDYIILHCSMEFHLAPVMYEEIFLTFRGSASDANENRKASAISFSLSFQFRSKKTKNNNMLSRWSVYCHHDNQHHELHRPQPLLVQGDEVAGVGGGHPGAVQPRTLLQPIAAHLVGIRPIGGQQGGRYYVKLQMIHQQQFVFTFMEIWRRPLLAFTVG